VFLAEQVETGRPVALKRILVQDDEHMEIIKREINFLVSLPCLSCSSSWLALHGHHFTPSSSHLIIIFRACNTENAEREGGHRALPRGRVVQEAQPTGGCGPHRVLPAR
jgi:hypothetical protein